MAEQSGPFLDTSVEFLIKLNSINFQTFEKNLARTYRVPHLYSCIIIKRSLLLLETKVLFIQNSFTFLFLAITLLSSIKA